MAAMRACPRHDGPAGRLESLDLLGAFADHVRSFVDVSRAAPAQGGGRHRQRHGRPGGARRVRRPAGRARGAVRRARRHLPEPSGRSDPGREPARPAGARARGGRRRRARLRRRRRPRVPRRRAGSAAVRLHHHRHRRGRCARQAPRRHDPAQLHLLEGRPRGGARARRHPGAHQGRAQLHQGGDGRDRRRLRRRALRALLLPRQLPGRLRLDRRAARARAARQDRAAAVRAAPALRPLRRVGRDQHAPSPTRPR